MGTKQSYEAVGTSAALKAVRILEFTATTKPDRSLTLEPLIPIGDPRLFLFEDNGLRVSLSYNQEQTIGRCEIRWDKPTDKSPRIYSRLISEKIFSACKQLWGCEGYVEIVCDVVTYVIPRYDKRVSFAATEFKDTTCGIDVCINPKPTNRAKKYLRDPTRMRIHKALKAVLSGEAPETTTDSKHLPTIAATGPQPPSPKAQPVAIPFPPLPHPTPAPAIPLLAPPPASPVAAK